MQLLEAIAPLNRGVAASEAEKDEVSRNIQGETIISMHLCDDRWLKTKRLLCFLGGAACFRAGALESQ